MVKRVNRYISIAAALILAISSISYSGVFAQEENRAVGILKGLGRISAEFDYQPSEEISRGEFVVNLLCLTDIPSLLSGASEGYAFSDVPASRDDADAIASARMQGIVSGESDSRFYPDDAVTVEQATAMLMRALGYGALCEVEGGYPSGYFSCASAAGILKRVEGSFSQPLRRSDMVQMFYNALNAKILSANQYEDGNRALNRNGETLLTSANIYHARGIVTANSKVSLYGGSETREDEIRIDAQTYSISDSSIENLLGYCAEFYYYEEDNSGERRILYIEQDAERNRVIEIDAEDIISASRTQYEYYSDIKRRTAAIGSEADFLLNGSPMYEFSQERLLPQTGSVRLIDNNGDGRYDAVFIDSYDIVIVKAIANDIIADRYDSSKNIDLSGLDGEEYTIKTVDGKEMTLEDIKEWSVLQVRRKDSSVTGKTEYDIIVNYASETGVLSKVRPEDGRTVVSIDVDSREFYSKQYTLTREIPQSIVDSLKPGLSIEFFVNADGEIAAIKTVSSEYNYAYLFSAGISADEETVLLKMYTERGEFEVLPCKRRNFVLDEHRYPTYTPSEMCGLINGSLIAPPDASGTSDNSYHMIRYGRNSKDEVYFVDTMTQSPEEKVQKPDGEEAYNGMRLTRSNYSQRYQSSTKSFSGVFNISADTVVFHIPQDENEKKFFSVSDASYFKNDTSYRATAYYTEYDQVRAPLAVVFASSGENLANDEPAIVTQIMNGVNEENESGYLIEMQKKSGIISCFAPYDTEFDKKDIEVGDVVRYSTDIRAQIKRIDKLFDRSEKTLWKNDERLTAHYLGGSDNYSYTDGMLIVANTVLRRKEDVVIMDVNPSYQSMRNLSFVIHTAPIFKLTKDGRGEPRIVRGSQMDILPREEYPENASCMFAYMSYGTIRWAYVIND